MNKFLKVLETAEPILSWFGFVLYMIMFIAIGLNYISNLPTVSF